MSTLSFITILAILLLTNDVAMGTKPSATDSVAKRAQWVRHFSPSPGLRSLSQLAENAKIDGKCGKIVSSFKFPCLSLD